jgi:hypothetical protein
MRETRNAYRVLIGKIEGKRGLGTYDINNIGVEASVSVGTGGCFPGVKWPGCEADHSPSCSAEVKSG